MLDVEAFAALRDAFHESVIILSQTIRRLERYKSMAAGSRAELALRGVRKAGRPEPQLHLTFERLDMEVDVASSGWYSADELMSVEFYLDALLAAPEAGRQRTARYEIERHHEIMSSPESSGEFHVSDDDWSDSFPRNL